MSSSVFLGLETSDLLGMSSTTTLDIQCSGTLWVRTQVTCLGTAMDTCVGVTRLTTRVWAELVGLWVHNFATPTSGSVLDRDLLVHMRAVGAFPCLVNGALCRLQSPLTNTVVVKDSVTVGTCVHLALVVHFNSTDHTCVRVSLTDLLDGAVVVSHLLEMAVFLLILTWV